MKQYQPLVLRIGISLVFLWFGINQLINPDYFISYIPDWAAEFTYLIVLNGIFEIVFGLLLLIGLFTKFSSAILTIHLMTITMSLGYNDVAVRDFGLMIATMVIFMNGADEWTLDDKLHRKELLKKAMKAHKS